MLVRWNPHPVIVTIRDNKDYIRVLSLYHHYRAGGPPKVLGSGRVLVRSLETTQCNACGE